VAVRGGRFIAAASNGTVVALDAETGATAWRADAGAPLTAGVGSDGRFTSVVTRDNELVTFENAQVRWRTARAGARGDAAPLVAGERVFVMGVDRAVHAYRRARRQQAVDLPAPG
jgi:outer membrane protein assembly factor BamB